MKDAQKDVPVTVLRACVTAILLYGLPVLAIISVIPPSQIKGKGVVGIPGRRRDRVQRRLRRRRRRDDQDRGGRVHPGAGLERLHVADGLRPVSQAVACYDGAGPRILGKFSAKLGTPINVNFLSGVLLDDRVHRSRRCSTVGSAADAFA